LAKQAISIWSTAVATHGHVQLVYGDEDRVSRFGVRSAPHFKPDFNYDLQLSQNYMGQCVLLETALVASRGGFKTDRDGVELFDMTLQVIEGVGEQAILHIPRVLCHRRLGTRRPRSIEAGATQDAFARVVVEHLSRVGKRATVEEGKDVARTVRVRYSVVQPAPTVSIIIPTRDQVHLLRACVESLQRLTTYPSYELLIVDNGSTEAESMAYLRAIEGPGVRVIRDELPFNFSRLMNLGVRSTTHDMVCLLNNDIEVLHSDWLHEMVSHAQQNDVGCVGARLWYPDGTLQHGGVILGYGGVAGHAHRLFPKGAPGYFGRAALLQSLSAVTAACMLVRREVFDAVGGFDEVFAVAFNDVDFCIRVRAAGYRNVWTPYAELTHHESVSRGSDLSGEKKARFEREIELMKSRWSAWLEHDPAYNPNLTLEREDFGLAWPPRGIGVVDPNHIG